jgi:formiminotetrahydrofolate cyclodeaminase
MAESAALDVASATLERYLDRLASADSAPGGGAAAALTAAQAAALLAMALRLSTDHAEALDPDAAQIWLERLDAARARLLALATEDGAAFAAVLAAYRLPGKDPDAKATRKAAVQSALRGAAAVPLAVMERATELLEAAAAIVPATKPTVVSDSGIAVELLGAALRASRLNVEVNLAYIKDDAFAESTRGAMTRCFDVDARYRKPLRKAARAAIGG